MSPTSRPLKLTPESTKIAMTPSNLVMKNVPPIQVGSVIVVFVHFCVIGRMFHDNHGVLQRQVAGATRKKIDTLFSMVMVKSLRLANNYWGQPMLLRSISRGARDRRTSRSGCVEFAGACSASCRACTMRSVPSGCVCLLLAMFIRRRLAPMRISPRHIDLQVGPLELTTPRPRSRFW